MSARMASRPRRWRRAAGAALVTAIFLLVALAGLATVIVSVMTAQQTAATLDQQGERAYQAARAGIEWGLWQRLRQPAQMPCAGSYSFALPTNTSLSAFTVTVSCEAAIDGHVTLTAIACNEPQGGACPNNAPSGDYVQRRLQAQL